MARYNVESTPGQKRSYQVWISAGAVVIVGLGVLMGVRLFRGRVAVGPQGPGSVLSVQSRVMVPAADSGTASFNPGLPQTQPAAYPAVPASVESSVNVAVAEAMAILNNNPGRLIEVRDKFNEIVKGPMTLAQSRLVRGKLSELADQWLFGLAVYPGDSLCQTYSVKSGDQLRIIGERYKVPYEFLMMINRLPRPEALRAGQNLKVVNGPFHVKISRSTFTLDVYLQTTFVKSYQVGLGRPGYETPTGGWIVKPGDKLIKPQWTDPDTGRVYRADDSDYPLGSRWIGLDGVEGNAVGRTGFAIHGTNDPNQISRQGSRGCIRLHNGDAIAVYNMLMPGLSKVQVVE
jgi:hypothetical protein